MRRLIGSRMLRVGIWFFFAIPGAWAAAQPATIDVVLRRQAPAAAAAAFRGVETPERWEAAETAVIVCDAWDLHHCKSAVDRLEEFAPRMAAFVAALRERGGTVIHAPSDCMAAYADHPARRRAADLAGRAPADTPRGWCHGIAAEAAAEYPLDQSLGGDDDPPATRAAWAAELRRRGADAARPWTRQTPLVPIDGGRDFISAAGDEIAGVLAARGIRNVLLVGVHANMCVLGRPFGLRRLVSAGRRVALVRDLTDTMYDPAQWPWVNHFTGTERMIDHVERHVCPTIGSDQLLGPREKPFRSPRDARPTVALVIAEDEYGSHRTLPALARRRLGGAFRVVEHHVAADDLHSIPGLERIAEADLLVLAVRRRGLPPGQMAALEAFLAAGKPVIGIRTASHPFEPRPPVGDRETWPEFDRDVFGIEYTGHFGKDVASVIRAAPAAVGHRLFTGVPTDGALPQTGSLYRIAPATPATVVLATGAIPGEAPQPVLTEFRRPDGGLSIYTSVGHPDDLARPEVERVLVNAVHVAAGLAPPRELDQRDPHDPFLRWVSVRRDGGGFPAASDLLARFPGEPAALWARTVIVPDAAAAERGLEFVVTPATTGGLAAGALQAWYDGRPLSAVVDERRGVVFTLPGGILTPQRPGVLAVEIAPGAERAFVAAATALAAGVSGATVTVDRWQIRRDGGRGAGFPEMPLPAQFGGPADSVTVLE